MLSKKQWVPYAFLAIPLTLYFIWVIFPIIQTVILSFTDWDGVSAKFNFIGWKNYLRLFSDSYFWLSLKNNIKWLIFFVIVAIPAGLGMAMLLDQKFPGNKVFKTLIRTLCDDIYNTTNST